LFLFLFWGCSLGGLVVGVGWMEGGGWWNGEDPLRGTSRSLPCGPRRFSEDRTSNRGTGLRYDYQKRVLMEYGLFPHMKSEYRRGSYLHHDIVSFSLHPILHSRIQENQTKHITAQYAGHRIPNHHPKKTKTKRHYHPNNKHYLRPISRAPFTFSFFNM
jgi:hypothetical protein